MDESEIWSTFVYRGAWKWEYVGSQVSKSWHVSTCLDVSWKFDSSLRNQGTCFAPLQQGFARGSFACPPVGFGKLCRTKGQTHRRLERHSWLRLDAVGYIRWHVLFSANSLQMLISSFFVALLVCGWQSPREKRCLFNSFYSFHRFFFCNPRQLGCRQMKPRKSSGVWLKGGLWERSQTVQTACRQHASSMQAACRDTLRLAHEKRNFTWARSETESQFQLAQGGKRWYAVCGKQSKNRKNSKHVQSLCSFAGPAALTAEFGTAVIAERKMKKTC